MWLYILCAGVLLYQALKWFLQSLRIRNYNQRYVLVTGCDTGFGNLLAKRLDKLGFHVFACCLTEQAQQEFRTQCSSKVIPVGLDVTKHDSVMQCLKIVEETLDDKELWGIVNNAGVGGAMAPLEMLQLSHVEWCVDVNLYGMIRVTQAFLPLLRKSRGRIVNTSSMGGRLAMGFVPYTVSKFGVEAFSDRLRRELYCTGVTVHIIEPGGFNTGIITPDKIRHDMTTLYEKADKEVQDYYGRQFIEKGIETMCKGAEKGISSDLWKVIDAYVHGLTARYPKYRYVVGLDAYFVVKLVANFPEWLQDYLFYRLAQAVPAKCKK